ncbi:MAG: radical SAM/SPASM domain-containing protein [Planctomycetota bacterium]
MEIKHNFFDPNITRKDKLLKNHLTGHVKSNLLPLFSLIEFNLCGLCNRRCIFCPKSDPKVFPNINKHMSVELYEKVMADLKKVDFDGTILYSAFSEPLLYKHLEEVIELSRRYCPKARIEIVTNGDLLTLENLFKLFRAGLTTVCISMYDGPQQLDHFKALGKRAGLEDSQLIFRPRWLSIKEHFGITLSNRAGAVEIKNIGIAALGEPLKRACYYPFYQVVIDYDGAVLLCAHDWKRGLIAGNLNEYSILDIWDNGIFKQVRITLAKQNRDFSPCNLCDVNGVFIGKDHFNKWGEYYKRQQSA